MPLYTKEGLRFENEEEAVHWFLSTLEDKTPLGVLYEKLHNETWGNYSIQATGVDEENFHIQLDAADHDTKVYRRIVVNSYAQPLHLEDEELIATLKQLAKSTDIAAITAYGVINKVRERIANDDQDLLKDVVTDFDKLALRVSTEVDAVDNILVIAITDTVTEHQYISHVGIDQDNRVKIEEVERKVEEMFKRVLQGEVNTLEISNFFRYAELNNSKIRLEIVE